MRIIFFILALILSATNAQAQLFGGPFGDPDIGDVLIKKHSFGCQELDTTPSNPNADNIKFYCKDDAGTTKLYTLDSTGTETELGAGGAGTPGGSTTQVQYNSAGSFAGNAGFVFVAPNVGIGSATPGQVLDVQGTVRATAFIGDGSGLTGIASGSGTVNTGTANYFAYYPASNTTVDDNTVLNVVGSNIGIGSPNPVSTLDVSGNITGNIFIARSPSTNPILYADGDSNTGVVLSGPDIFEVHTGGLNSLTINASQNVGIGSLSPATAPQAQLHVVNSRAINSFIVDDTDAGDTTPFVINSVGNVGIGSATPQKTLDVVGTGRFVGTLDVVHTATEVDDHAVEIDVNTAGFGDVKAIDVNYITGTLAAGEDEGIILVDIDDSLATGGEVFGYEIITTDFGSTAVYGMKTGVDVNPISQDSGTFANPNSALNKAVNVLTEVSSGGAGNITMFVANGDTITIGNSNQFDEIEFLIDINASGAGIAPTFEYSTGVGTWTVFTPTDGTNGFKNTGAILWDPNDIAGWAIGTGSEFLIRITRTRVSLTTSPRIDTIQVASAVIYSWDKNGVITGNTIEATGDTAADDNSALGYTATEGAILTGQGSTDDVTIKNDADSTVFHIPTGTTTGVFNGNVGIGSSTPGTTLDVQGTIRASSTITASNFSGTSSGTNTGDNTVATTGDSATGFFSSGTIEHERGGLEADINAYDGLVGITGGATFNQTGTTTQIIIFDGAGAPTSAALSGDATMTNGGVVTVVDDLHAHTTTSISGVDISADTNLAVSGTLATLTGDTISVKEGTLTDEKVCTYELTGTMIDCNEAETGTGNIVRADGPTLTAPILGTIASGVGTALTAINDDNVAFDDADSNFVATAIGPAVEELDDVNGSGVNAADGKVEWSQLVGVPAGFADGADASGSGSAAGGLNAIQYNSPLGTFAGDETKVSFDGTNVGIGTTNGNALVSINSTGAQNLFRVDDNGVNDTSPFVIDSNGNIGIGTTNTSQLALSILANGGNVGIGTWVQNSTYRFYVNGITGINSNINATLFADMSNSTFRVDPAGATWSGVPMSAALSNNVGIGTVVANNQLSVRGGVGIGTTMGSIYLQNTATGGGMIVEGNVGIGTLNLINDLSVVGNASIGSVANVGIAGPANGLYVEGNVGIGSLSPGQVLDVNGAIRTINAGTAAAPSLIVNTIGNGLWAPAANVLGVSTNAIERIRIDSGGNIGIGTTTPVGALIVMNGNVGIGTWKPAGKLEIKGSGNNSFSGNIGIGTTTVPSSLYVVGSGDFTTGLNIGIGTASKTRLCIANNAISTCP